MFRLKTIPTLAALMLATTGLTAPVAAQEQPGEGT